MLVLCIMLVVTFIYVFCCMAVCVLLICVFVLYTHCFCSAAYMYLYVVVCLFVPVFYPHMLMLPTLASVLLLMAKSQRPRTDGSCCCFPRLSLMLAACIRGGGSRG
eukprot:GHVS01031943.1.p1 GENE.GHVS01031943.1~~GHVS01031943.1.p1  ORF type:complete len:106 (-),score=6.89 GHVS01031943.1:43-360(-)